MPYQADHFTGGNIQINTFSDSAIAVAETYATE